MHSLQAVLLTKNRSLQTFLIVKTVVISAVLRLTKSSRSGNSSNKEVPSLSGSSANQNCYLYFRFFFAVAQLVEELR